MGRFGMLALAFIAQTAMAADVKVENVWMRATVPGQQVAGAYMDITSPVNARLVGVQSAAAGSMEIHFMRIHHGVMEMREVKALPLPRGKTVKLAPGGFHLMLFDLKRPFKTGETVPIKLTIETADKKRETMDVTAQVRDLNGQMMH
ncbi:transporter [Sulfuriferula plumbiphila]|uniref:Transporter n=1 Tax=Sulfuriferula plumbiphila TaxID=171865 RepID=A0A512L370_9PROT|nr:copper chaperone PCu(A)C [Sulfuriferula plumbiphila]BBP02598.1 transporter [Sulfuriferula plumbiphila]GEP28892.1 transporter [Sulfuriferula plumbiphila]